MGSNITIETQPAIRRVIAAALVAEFALFILNYLFNYYDIAGDLSIRRMFNIAREQSIPTFFASLQAVAVGLTALAIGLTAATTESGRRPRRWLFVAAFWIYVGVDDNAEIHERLGAALRRATEGSALVDWWEGFSWQLFLAPILAAGLFGVVVVAWGAAQIGREMLVVCLACFAVAQGIDVLEGIENLFDDWADDLDVAPYTVGHGLRSIEEMLEMLGTTAYWSVILPILGLQMRRRSIKFT